ncbi:MAG: tyrosine-type recombinase/integrase [Pseudomonadota bacterium]
MEQADILRVLGPIWVDKAETARRVRQRLRVILDWARTAGHRQDVNPVEGVERALPKQRDRVKHHAATPWAEVPSIMRRLADAEGMGALALRFAILTPARSGEVRGATRAQIDTGSAAWPIPAERMKAGRAHRVPLAAPAPAILGQARQLAARNDGLIFPSRANGKPLSDMTLSAALKRLEIPVTVHGFRSSFRDWAEERTTYAR